MCELKVGQPRGFYSGERCLTRPSRSYTFTIRQLTSNHRFDESYTKNGEEAIGTDDISSIYLNSLTMVVTEAAI